MSTPAKFDSLSKRFRPSWEHAVLLAISIYYVARLIYFAATLDPSVPPDEVAHLELCEMYAESIWIPERDPQAECFERAIAGYTPYAYYLLAGKLLHLNIFGMSNLMFLRSVSVALGVLSVYIGWRAVCLLSENILARILFLIMMTNTLMLIVTQSMVTYDALVNLLASLSILFLIKLFKDPTSTTLLALCLSLSLGTLTKTTFIPFAFIVVMCVLFHERAKIGELKALWQDFVLSLTPPRWAALGLLTIFILLNIGLYGGNLVRFGHLAPRPEQVLSIAQIMNSPSWARNFVAKKYLSGEISPRQAVQLASSIKLDAARNDTLAILGIYEAKRRAGERFEKESRLGYAYFWVPHMAKTTYGILGHRIMYKENVALVPYLVIFLAAAISLLVRKPSDPAPYNLYLFAILTFYALILMQFVGYRVYSTMHIPEMAVQGRYLFPVLVPAYALVAPALLKPWSRRIQIGVLVAVSLVFIEGDFIFYLRNASEFMP